MKNHSKGNNNKNEIELLLRKALRGYLYRRRVLWDEF